VQGSAGQRVQLRYAEMLNLAGLLINKPVTTTNVKFLFRPNFCLISIREMWIFTPPEINQQN
jgi:hypothetical protein